MGKMHKNVRIFSQKRIWVDEAFRIVIQWSTFQKLPLPYACNSLVEYLLSEVVSIAI